MNVLYLIFNRPHLQTASFEQIRAARPQRVFIAADGPRAGRDDDSKKCDEARRIVDKIDWPCEVKTLFRDQNLGCRRAISEAITWFFRHVEDGIIIEDDCVASQAFFELAESLLNYYRDEHQIWCISGSNFQNGQRRGDGSYYFSRYFHCWGWATWRRCWMHYDDDLLLWQAVRESHSVRNAFMDEAEGNYWRQVWNDLLLPKPVVDTWDYRWSCATILNGGLTALPNGNLVTNIGFEGEGLHCFGKSPDPGLEAFDAKIIHPTLMLRDIEADQWTFKKIFGGEQIPFPKLLVQRIHRKLSRLLS